MSTLLVVKAHPLTSNESRSLKALDAFLESYKETNPTDTVTILDVYHDFVPEIDKDMLMGWANAQSGKEMTLVQSEKVNRFSALTEQFLNSDKIVIANPLWNLNIPTRLKAWVDTINVAGKTFKYTENGPVGLVSDKKLVHIQSSGGVYEGQDPSSLFINNIFRFIGVTDIHSVVVEGIDHNPAKAEEIMADALAKATLLGKNF